MRIPTQTGASHRQAGLPAVGIFKCRFPSSGYASGFDPTRRSSNYAETSQSDNQHRLCNLSRRRYRRRIIRAGRALHAGMPGTEGNRLILQQRVTLWKNIKLDLFRLSVFGSLWVGGFEVFMDTPVVEDLHWSFSYRIIYYLFITHALSGGFHAEQGIPTGGHQHIVTTVPKVNG